MTFNNKCRNKCLLLLFGCIGGLIMIIKHIDHDKCHVTVLDECVDCDRLVDDDSEYRVYWAAKHQPIQEDIPGCSHIQRMLTPHQSTVVDLRIAYSILAHKDWQHVLQLLLTIWHPSNHYCIHVDAKSVGLFDKMQSITRCMPNVFLAKRMETVYWAGFPILRAHLNCLEDVSTRQWDYWINLSAQDVPLKSNSELVHLLRSWNGANNMETVIDSHTERYSFVHQLVNNRFGHASHNVRTQTRKSPPPYNLTIYKSNVAVVLNRKFTDWLIRNNTVSDRLLEWLTDTEMPDEHYWSTMIMNRQVHAGETFELIQPYMARLAEWRTNTSLCAGKYIRDVCVFGVGDLARLQSNVNDYLFANKMYLGYQTAAHRCMQSWIIDKNMEKIT